MVVCGRQFSGETISRIQAAVNGDDSLSRRKLSRHVCEWLDWRSPSGRLQEMSCRKALAELHRRRVLILPEIRRTYGFERAREVRLDIETPEVCCSLEELGEVKVSRVTSRYCRDSKIAQALLKRYHYLGSGLLRGAQMRYVVTSARWGYLGVLTFSSGTWALADRDDYIGWSEAQRRANLQQVVCNDRFLILPTVHVQNLASHVLALTLQRLPGDWEQRYAVRPVLAETFVDSSRFEGTCYKAANWTKVGQSSGRRDGIAKAIFLYALSPQWREYLCAPSRLGGWGRRRVRNRRPVGHTRSSAASDFMTTASKNVSTRLHRISSAVRKARFRKPAAQKSARWALTVSSKTRR